MCSEDKSSQQVTFYKMQSKTKKMAKRATTALSYHHRSMMTGANKKESTLKLDQPGHLFLPNHAPLVLLEARMRFYYTN